MEPVTLTTARLLMRPWREEDRAPLAEINADPEVMRFYPAPLTRAESDASLDRMRAGFTDQGFERWALESRSGGDLIGLTGLTPMPDWSMAAGGWEVGWRLRRSAWGHGYATEAALAARDFAYDRLGMAELWSWTATVNTPSIAVMRRIGLREVAVVEHELIPKGHPLRPHVLYRGTPELGDHEEPGG
jgi:RimJ/RimL family protein N-acetyltransferase